MLQASQSIQQEQACCFASILFSFRRMSEALWEVPSMQYNWYGRSSETIFVVMFQDKGNWVFLGKINTYAFCSVL